MGSLRQRRISWLDSRMPTVTRFLVHAFLGRKADALAAVTPDIEAVAGTSDVFARFLAEGYAVAGVPDRAMH
jgi:hypothetical protein